MNNNNNNNNMIITIITTTGGAMEHASEHHSHFPVQMSVRGRESPDCSRETDSSQRPSKFARKVVAPSPSR